jgi:hypothetical protein
MSKNRKERDNWRWWWKDRGDVERKRGKWRAWWDRYRSPWLCETVHVTGSRLTPFISANSSLWPNLQFASRRHVFSSLITVTTREKNVIQHSPRHNRSIAILSAHGPAGKWLRSIRLKKHTDRGLRPNKHRPNSRQDAKWTISRGKKKQNKILKIWRGQ